MAPRTLLFVHAHGSRPASRRTGHAHQPIGLEVAQEQGSEIGRDFTIAVLLIPRAVETRKRLRCTATQQLAARRNSLPFPTAESGPIPTGGRPSPGWPRHGERTRSPAPRHDGAVGVERLVQEIDGRVDRLAFVKRRDGYQWAWLRGLRGSDPAASAIPLAGATAATTASADHSIKHPSVAKIGIRPSVAC